MNAANISRTASMEDTLITTIIAQPDPDLMSGASLDVTFCSRLDDHSQDIEIGHLEACIVDQKSDKAWAHELRTDADCPDHHACL
jgi:hypothetical protein